nr:DNA-binding domain-containing protein [uncultured Roseateles sp.]
MSASLLQQQQALSRWVCEPGAAAPSLLKPQGRPGIYQHAYRARLIAALSDNYTVLQRALGDEGFEALALAYIAAHPSRQASIRWFGDRLADFMLTRDDLVPHPALVDFARMDWALRGAFDAADVPALSLQDLSALAPDEWLTLSFRLQPSVLRLALDWAIEPAWHVLRDFDPEGGEEAPAMPEPQGLAHTLLVWRQGLETRWRSLEAGEAALLQGLAQGQDFAALCAMLAEQLGEEDRAAQAAVALLSQWLGDGLLRH